MTDFLRLVVECAAYLWPCRLVNEWEQGSYYRLGRFQRTVGPGVYFVLPFFQEVRALSVVYQELDLPLQSIRTRAGTVLTFSANVGVTIDDAGLAFNKVDDYENTIRKSAAGHLAEALAEVEAGRLEPEARGRLLAALKKTLDGELSEYGVRVRRIRFTDLVEGARVYRLFNDQTLTTTSR